MAEFGLYGQLIRKSLSDTIDADLLKGVTGRKVFTNAAVTGGVLTLTFQDENNSTDTMDVTLGGDPEVFRLNDDGSRPDITETIWEAGALLIEPTGLYTAERHVVSTTRPSGTWNRYQVSNFYEAYNQYGFPATAPNGSRGYTRHSHQFWTKNPAGIWIVSDPPPGHRYLGVKSDEDDATDATVENGDLAFFDGHLRVVSNFIATNVTYAFEWENAIPDARRLDEDEATDGSSDVFGAVSGQRLEQAIEAHPLGQHTWLAELRIHYREPEAGAEAQFHIVQGAGDVRILEFSNLLSVDNSLIESVPASAVVGLHGALFTVTSSSIQTDGDRRLTGSFDAEPTLVNEVSYKLRFNVARPIAPSDLPPPDNWLTGTLYVVGQMALRYGNIYIALLEHTSSSSNAPGTTGGRDEWALVRQASEIQYAAGRSYQPGQVVSNGGSSQVFICRRPTTNEPSTLNDNWMWLPYGAYTLEASTGAYRYRRGNIVFTGTEVYFIHTTPPGAGLTAAQLATSPAYVARLESIPLTDDEIDDATSVIQGTISGRGIARGVQEHERFTDVEQDILEDLSRITYPHPTDDWQVRQTYSVRDFFSNPYSTFLSLGWDSDNRLRALSGDGHVARFGGHDRGRIYDGSETLRAGLISGVHWLFLRDNTVHGGSDIERAPVDGGDSEVEFEINSIRYFSMFADPDSGTLIGILRRINATDMEVGLLAYDSAAGTVIAEDTITLDLAHINNALGADFATITNIHNETAGGTYQGVAGAILEGDTLYVLLTDITKADGHTASVLVGYTLAGTPNNRTLTILAENAVDELPILDELRSGLLPLEADELFLARDTAVYRLSGPEPGVVATDDTITGDGTEAAPIGVAAPYPGPVTWPTLGARPDRPTAQEIIDGTSVDEAASSVSDIVAVANAHSQRTLANEDPEPVGATAAEGTGGTVSRRDHTHALPVDDTLEFDPVSGDLRVNVHDVIQHLQENIRYYTDSIDHPADPGGHSAGQMYRTGPFPTTISRVQSQIDVLVGHPSYAARIYRVGSDRRIEALLAESSHFVPLSNNPHSYDFTGDDGIGIPIPADSHIVILFHAVGGVLIPLRTGDEASGSPGKSYQDANRDFDMLHSVVYEHVHPSVGDSTASHGDADHIRGNIKIYYDIAYDHGSLVGADKANTDLQNIDEDLTEAEQAAIRDRIGVTDEISLVVASSVTQPNSLIQGGLPRFRMNVNTPGDGEPLDGQVLKFRFDGPFVNTVASNTYSFASFTVSLFLNNTDLFSTAREGAFVYPDGRAVRGDDFPAGVDAYALKTPDGYVWLTSGDLLSGVESTVDAADVDDVDEVAVIRHTVGRDPTRRLSIGGLRTVMTDALSFANRNLDNIILDDKAARDGHRVAIGVAPPSKDFPFGSGELLGDVFAGLNNIVGATGFRNSLYGVDSGFTPARLVRIDTDDPRNDVGPYGSLGDLDPGIDDPQSLVAVGERLYIVNGNATSAGLWRINLDDPGDTSGVYGRVGGFPAGLTNPRGALPANADIYVIQGNAAPVFDELWRINEFDPASTANPLGLQYSLPANITGAPTSGVSHDGYAYIVTGSGRQLFRIDPDNLSHGQPTTSDNRFGLVGVLPIPNTETVTAAASLGGVFYVFTGAQIWAKSVGNVEFDRVKANIDLQNIRDNLTDDEKLVVRDRIGAASSQQQQAAGRSLASRTIVSGGTLLAANAFNFDVTSDDAFVAAGLGFAAVPLADIFDFVATVRIGGRAGNPIRLSREQFDYIGRTTETVFGTWPFGGSGGSTYGDVSEIPCVMMYVNHRSEGVVKNALNPQRRQIRWSMSDPEPATAILIFFNADAAQENLVSLRLVAFTDQVVEIEGMHVHYWEDA